MKNNQPVTQNEVAFPPNVYLVSKTDLKGQITDCNDAFVQISGFTREELLGKSHNIVRHPDMPMAAFKDLWRTVQAGLPWRGLVKNRCKNGDFYWVEALVTPLKKNGQIIGYMSVRTPPDPQARAEAEARYRAAGVQGRLPASGRRSVSLGTRLRAAMATLGVLCALLGFFGVQTLNNGVEALHAMYQHHLQPSNVINRVMFLLADNRSQIMLSLQHDPGSPVVSLHDHPLDMHVQTTLKNREEINALLAQLRQLPLTAEQQTLLARFAQTRERFSQEGVNVAREQLKNGQYHPATLTLLTRINPLYADMRRDGEALIQSLADSAARSHAERSAEFDRFRWQGIGLAALALLIAGVGSFLLRRAVVRPIQHAIAHFDRIREGDLTAQIDVGGRDEAGMLLCNLASMQVTLKAMLDNIQRASQAIDARGAELAEHMAQVSAQSDAQQTRAASVAAATEEFSQSVQEVADSARQAADAADASRQQVQTSNADIQTSMRATQAVVRTVEDANHTIERLNQSISQIGDMTRTIADIADQTNLLALNAAIEAARAGETGRGFAVVADEVRKLAERTTAATVDIAATVNEVRATTASAVSSMAGAAQAVEHSVSALDASVAGLDAIERASEEVAGMAAHISAAAAQQGAASAEVAGNMQQVTQLAERNTELAHSATRAAQDVLAASHQLQALNRAFQLHRRA